VGVDSHEETSLACLFNKDLSRKESKGRLCPSVKLDDRLKEVALRCNRLDFDLYTSVYIV
jgi:hypothetical protein